MSASKFVKRPGGSSPRTRGTGRIHQHIPGRVRFIPAHAGNRRVSGFRPAPATVHPRARGEQGCMSPLDKAIDGSSPRTRGTAQTSCLRAASRRFIPAHAGNRNSSRVSGRPRTVHPRARGEQVLVKRTRRDSTGSSPRTRGTGHYDAALQILPGFIPAHAGNRPCRGGDTLAAAVHPRARGEQSVTARCSAAASGSSPRTRGTGHMGGEHGTETRFIPAHAGNSRVIRQSVH